MQTATVLRRRLSLFGATPENPAIAHSKILNLGKYVYHFDCTGGAVVP